MHNGAWSNLCLLVTDSTNGCGKTGAFVDYSASAIVCGISSLVFEVYAFSGKGIFRSY